MATAAFRSYVKIPKLGLRLEALGAKLPIESIAGLIALVEKRLGNRTLVSLRPRELDEMRALIRTEMARTAPGAQMLQREFVRDMGALHRVAGRDLFITNVDLPSGVWQFYHSRARVDPVVVGEAFVPRRVGGTVPKRRPDPAAAGLAGKPRWKHPDGDVRADPPPIPQSPKRAPSGLSANAMDSAPDAVLAEVRRAQTEGLAEAKRIEDEVEALTVRDPTQSEDVFRTGSLIHNIELRGPEGGGKAWDQLWIITTHTGPEIKRLPGHVLRKKLPPLKDPRFKGLWARCHAAGPVVGDETLAGLAWCPHQAINLLQLATAEGFLRWRRTPGKPLNVKARTPLTIKVYIEHVEVDGIMQPFLRKAQYEFELEGGARAQAYISIDAEGNVDADVL